MTFLFWLLRSPVERRRQRRAQRVWRCGEQLFGRFAEEDARDFDILLSVSAEGALGGCGVSRLRSCWARTFAGIDLCGVDVEGISGRRCGSRR